MEALEEARAGHKAPRQAGDGDSSSRSHEGRSAVGMGCAHSSPQYYALMARVATVFSLTFNGIAVLWWLNQRPRGW